MDFTAADLAIRTIGPCRIDSPLSAGPGARQMARHYVDESCRVLVDSTSTVAAGRGLPLDRLPPSRPPGPGRRSTSIPPRPRWNRHLCGLCPGLNDVIRGIVLHLHRHYGVRRVIGFRNGYRGFIPKYRETVMDLTRRAWTASRIRRNDLGTSRGSQDPEEIVDCLQRMDIDILFVIGGDGSMRGAIRIAKVAAERSEQWPWWGSPDHRTTTFRTSTIVFGFQTAFSRAAQAVHAAHVEASSAPNGGGWSRSWDDTPASSPANAALSRGDADFVLIPEVPFGLEGPDGFPDPAPAAGVAKRGHAVVVLAEGAGQEYLDDGAETRDAPEISGCATSFHVAQTGDR